MLVSRAELTYFHSPEITKSPISTLSNELAHHPAARQRITREMKVRGLIGAVSRPLLLNLVMSTAQARRRRLVLWCRYTVVRENGQFVNYYNFFMRFGYKVD